MERLTVVYKYDSKVYIGVVDDTSYLSHFDRLMVNEKDFATNVFYIMMVGEGDKPDIFETDVFKCDFSTIEDDDMFIVMANRVLQNFKNKAVLH